MSHPALNAGRMAHAMSSLIAQWFRGLGLNGNERTALLHLWASGPMMMSDLGVRIPMSRAAVTSLTDRLEAHHYVERAIDLTDRRRTLLSLTGLPARHVSPYAIALLREIELLEATFDDRQCDAIYRWSRGVEEICDRLAAELRDGFDDALPESGATTVEAAGTSNARRNKRAGLPR